MPEINLDDANHESRALAVIQAVQKHHALVKINRVLILAVFFLMAVVFVMGFVVMPKYSLRPQSKSDQMVLPNKLYKTPLYQLKSPC